jgi:hypothetical protein
MVAASDPNMIIGGFALGGLALAGLWRFVVWVREAPTTPDPWGTPRLNKSYRNRKRRRFAIIALPRNLPPCGFVPTVVPPSALIII